MRKRFRVPLLAAIVAAVAVPVGFALSLESAAPVHEVAASHGIVATSVSTSVVSPLVVGSAPASTDLHAVPDAAKLFFVGTALFGLAAAVRRAI